MFFCESNNCHVAAKSGLHEIEEELKNVMRSIRGTPMIYDVVEYARQLLYNNFAKKAKYFNKRIHMYQEESEKV